MAHQMGGKRPSRCSQCASHNRGVERAVRRAKRSCQSDTAIVERESRRQYLWRGRLLIGIATRTELTIGWSRFVAIVARAATEARDTRDVLYNPALTGIEESQKKGRWHRKRVGYFNKLLVRVLVEARHEHPLIAHSDLLHEVSTGQEGRHRLRVHADQFDLGKPSPVHSIAFTADEGRRGGKTIATKAIVDVAVKDCPSVEHILLLKRTGMTSPRLPLTPGRDIWWHEETAKVRNDCPSEGPLFILYTSESTGKPKGIVHTTGGYLLGATLTVKYIFGLHPDDRFAAWSTSAGSQATPTSSTACSPYASPPPSSNPPPSIQRLANRPNPPSHPILLRPNLNPPPPPPRRASRRRVRSQHHPCPRHRPRADQPRGLAVVRYRRWPGSVRDRRYILADRNRVGFYHAVPGCDRNQARLRDRPFLRDRTRDSGPPHRQRTRRQQRRRRTGVQEALAVHRKDGVWEHKRYLDTHMNCYPWFYFTGDGASRDEDGYIWIKGRVNGVINISGHRLPTAEIESALILHKGVAGTAVIGAADELTGQAVHAFVTLKPEYKYDDEASLVKELIIQVRKVIRLFAAPKKIFIVGDLPKTRSGGIMRRIMRKIVPIFIGAGKDFPWNAGTKTPHQKTGIEKGGV